MKKRKVIVGRYNNNNNNRSAFDLLNKNYFDRIVIDIVYHSILYKLTKKDIQIELEILKTRN